MDPQLILTFIGYAIGFSCTYLAVNAVAPAFSRIGLVNGGGAPNSVVDIGSFWKGLALAIAVFAAGFAIELGFTPALAALSMKAFITVQTNVVAHHAFSIACASLMTWYILVLTGVAPTNSVRGYVNAALVAVVVCASDSGLTHVVNKVYGAYVMPHVIGLLQTMYGAG